MATIAYRLRTLTTDHQNLMAELSKKNVRFRLKKTGCLEQTTRYAETARYRLEDAALYQKYAERADSTPEQDSYEGLANGALDAAFRNLARAWNRANGLIRLCNEP